MIDKWVDSEFGRYKITENCGHRVNYSYMCTDAYSGVPDEEEWLTCPYCNLKPKVWRFNNGRGTACGCGNSRYDHFSICAESIMSVHTRCNGNTSVYDPDELRKNWNDYCITEVPTVMHEDLRLEGKW